MQLTKSQIKEELWRRGEVSWKLHSGQKRILENIGRSTDFLVVNMCARQFGKTVFNCFEAVKDCLQQRSIVKYGAAFYSDLEKYIFPTFREFLSDCPDHLKPEVIESKKQILFKNGSVIDFIGLDRHPDGLRGNKVRKVIIDEAGFVDKLRYVYYDVVVPMFTHTMHLNPKCIMSGTPPESPDHAFTSFFKPKAISENAFMKLTIDDNPLLTQPQRDRLIGEYFKGVSTELHRKVQWQKMRRELYCDVIIDQERAIVPEWDNKYIEDVQKDKYFQFYHKYVSMDLGVRDKTVALFAYYDFSESTLVILDELQMHGSNMTTKVLHQALKEKESQVFNSKVYRRIADSNNPLLLQDLSIQYGMQYLPVKKATDGDRKTLQAMVNKMRVFVGQGRLKIDPKCTELIGCLQNGIWDTHREKFDTSESYGHFDALAALMYLIKSLNETDSPIPFLHGKDKFNYWYQEPKKKFLKIFS